MAADPPEWLEGGAHYRALVMQFDQLAKNGPQIPAYANCICNFSASGHRKSYAVNLALLSSSAR